MNRDIDFVIKYYNLDFENLAFIHNDEDIILLEAKRKEPSHRYTNRLTRTLLDALHMIIHKKEIFHYVFS